MSTHTDGIKLKKYQLNAMVMNAKKMKIVRDRVLWNMDETLYLFLQLYFFKILQSDRDSF